MKITVKWFGDQFNIGLSNGDKPEFLSIKGCRLKSGERGEFISWPSQKKDDGTYWRHVWGSDEFQAAVIKEAKKGEAPVAKAPKAELDDVPF